MLPICHHQSHCHTLAPNFNCSNLPELMQTVKTRLPHTEESASLEIINQLVSQILESGFQSKKIHKFHIVDKECHYLCLAKVSQGIESVQNKIQSLELYSWNQAKEFYQGAPATEKEFIQAIDHLKRIEVSKTSNHHQTKIEEDDNQSEYYEAVAPKYFKLNENSKIVFKISYEMMQNLEGKRDEAHVLDFSTICMALNAKLAKLEKLDHQHQEDSRIRNTWYFHVRSDDGPEQFLCLVVDSFGPEGEDCAVITGYYIDSISQLRNKTGLSETRFQSWLASLSRLDITDEEDFCEEENAYFA